MIVAFCPEEQVEAFGETLTLRLDFQAITTIEGALDVSFPVAIAHARSMPPSYSILSRVLWCCLRKHHPDISIDQALAMVVSQEKDGEALGFALDALLERALPAKEDKEPKNGQSGQSKASAASG